MGARAVQPRLTREPGKRAFAPRKVYKSRSTSGSTRGRVGAGWATAIFGKWADSVSRGHYRPVAASALPRSLVLTATPAPRVYTHKAAASACMASDARALLGWNLVFCASRILLWCARLTVNRQVRAHGRTLNAQRQPSENAMSEMYRIFWACLRVYIYRHTL